MTVQRSATLRRRRSQRNGDASVTMADVVFAFGGGRYVPKSLLVFPATLPLREAWTSMDVGQLLVVVRRFLVLNTLDRRVVARAAIVVAADTARVTPALPLRAVIAPAFADAVAWSQGRADEHEVLRSLRVAVERGVEPVATTKDEAAYAMWYAAQSVVGFASVDPAVLYEARHMDDDVRVNYLDEMARLCAITSLEASELSAYGRSKAARARREAMADTVRAMIPSSAIEDAVVAAEQRRLRRASR